MDGLAKVGIRVVRLGRPEQTRPELLQFATSSIVEQALREQNADMLPLNQQKQLKHDALMRALGSAQVICATCVGAGSGQLDKRRFAGVLVDEASQATEIACVVPLLRGCQQLVMVHQLPPTIASEDASSRLISIPF